MPGARAAVVTELLVDFMVKQGRQTTELMNMLTHNDVDYTVW